MARDIFCCAIPLTMLFAAVLSFSTGVVGCWWPIYDRAVLMAVAFWQYSNNSPNSASMDDANTFLIILHYLPSKVNRKCVYEYKCRSKCVINEVKFSMCDAIYILTHSRH